MAAAKQSPGNVLQHCIAGRVAERVIDLLESVYIDHQQRKALFECCASRNRASTVWLNERLLPSLVK
jgi:hypothetical protein